VPKVSRLVSSSPTIGALERPDVQRLIYLARADPTNWTERTPGAGAVALLAILGRGITLVSSSFVLAAFALWLVPLFIIPAVIFQRLNRNEGVKWYTTWRDGSSESLRRRVWSAANFDAGQAKELRIFGLGEYAVGRSYTMSSRCICRCGPTPVG
jgi:ATP-binding cassette subfamily B protein